LGSSFAPPALESVDEPFLDGGTDVAVDAPDAGQSVPEPLGLCGFGDFVFDEPGLVGVAQVVEMHPGQDRRDVFGGVAVQGRPPAAALETGASQQPAVTADEGVFMVVAGQVFAEQVDQERRQQDVADRCRSLGRSEAEVAADLVQRAMVGVDVDARVVELAVQPAQPGQLAQRMPV